MTNMVMVAVILERLRYLFQETNHESQVIAKVNDDLLLPVCEHWKQIMEDSDANHNLTDDQAEKFKEIMRFCFNLENIIESYLPETASRRDRLLNMIFKRSRQQIKVIKRLSQELADMISSIPRASKPFVTPPAHQLLQTIQADAVETEADGVETEQSFVQMEEEVVRLMDVLIGGYHPHLYMVSICGMGGTGKTSLARKLFQNGKIAGCFQVRGWVCVSWQFESKRVFLDILAVTSNKWFERREAMDMREEELAELVYKSLKGRRYLIVLDDVWSNDTWPSLRMAFPDDCNGSRVLITTRNRQVAGQVDGYIHEPSLLTAESSWELFRRKLNLKETDIDANPELKLICEQIIMLCCGLPLSLLLMAGSLSKIPLNAWKEIVEQLSSATVSTGEGVLNTIRLSYKYLPLHLRPCLLYLGYFTKDTAIPIEWETVCQLWIAEGLISMENIRNGDTMMDVAARYLDELASRSLLITENQDSGQRRLKSFRIHDLIFDLCRYEGEVDEFFEVIQLRNGNRNMSSSIRQAIHLGNSDEYADSHLYGNADYLRSLLFFTSNLAEEGIIRPQEIPDLGNFIWLRVLYLYGVDFNDGKLPKGIEKLVYLRYLGFKECYLEELSSLVGNMLYLQTLDLRVRNECEMTITDVFKSFKRLKYMYFPLAYRTLNHEKLHLGKLKELEILDNFDTSVCSAEDLCGLTNLKELKVTTEGDVSEIETILNALENNTSRFRSVSLSIRCFDCHSRRRFSAMEKVFNSSAVHVLEVEGYLGKLPVFDVTSSKLTEIILNGSELVEDSMQMLQKLPNLTILVLEIEAYNKENMKCSLDGFYKLRFLKLLKLYKLKSWEVEEGALPSLHTLVIENCKNLQMLPDGLEYCEELKKLEITCMPDEFVGRIQKSDGTEGEDFYKIHHVQPNVKIDGQHLILKERQQAGPREDPQSSSAT